MRSEQDRGDAKGPQAPDFRAHVEAALRREAERRAELEASSRTVRGVRWTLAGEGERRDGPR